MIIKRFLTTLIITIAVIMLIPLLIVTLMSRTIDNSPQGSERVIEESIENGAVANE